MKKLFKKFWDSLLYITNNEKESRHEQLFDILFFFVNTIGLFFGVYLLTTHGEPHWIPFLVIEYSWALDNMRHNRP
jgi:hypothetical protein